MNDFKPKPDRYSHPGVAGRKPLPNTLVRRALALVDKKLPDIFSALIQKAIEGDREAMIYLIDRRLGKPSQQTDLDIKGEVSVGTLVRLLGMMEGSDAIQREKLLEGKAVEPGDIPSVNAIEPGDIPFSSDVV